MMKKIKKRRNDNIGRKKSERKKKDFNKKIYKQNTKHHSKLLTIV